jgi:hypothetical protein
MHGPATRILVASHFAELGERIEVRGFGLLAFARFDGAVGRFDFLEFAVDLGDLARLDWVDEAALAALGPAGRLCAKTLRTNSNRDRLMVRSSSSASLAAFQ